MQRWALQAVREDARRARRDIAERALVADARAPGRRRRSRASSPRTTRSAGRLDAFMRTLSREGTADMAGLALAVRQLRALAE